MEYKLFCTAFFLFSDKSKQQKSGSKKSNNWGNQWVNEVYSYLLGDFRYQLDFPNDYDKIFIDSYFASTEDAKSFHEKCKTKLEQSAVVHLTFETGDIVEKRKELRMTFTAGLANLGIKWGAGVQIEKGGWPHICMPQNETFK